MHKHEKINYVEMPFNDLDATKSFFSTVFGWELQEWGSDYLAFTGEGLDGGFYKTNQTMRVSNGSALVIFYSIELESTLGKVQNTGADVCTPTYYFPGGRRFHFLDPNGNEFAVWSDREPDGTIIQS